MKKLILGILIVFILAVPTFAKSETAISISAGVSTGIMGFTGEKIFNFSAYHLGVGVTPSTIRTATGVRFYLPGKDFVDGKRLRSNVFIGPNIGMVLTWTVDYNFETGKEIFRGYVPHYWGGITAGYDHRWGNYNEYRLIFEGGFGITQDIYDPHIPILNIGLGYCF